MKIYNKKTFRYGLGFIVLGALLLLTGIWQGFDLKGTVMTVLCLLIGGGGLVRSFSREMSREDKIAELVCFVCILFSIFGMQVMEAFFGGMLAAFGLMLTAMLLVELLTLVYYNKRL